MATVSFVAGTVGLQIQFTVLDGGQPISNAASAVVTWLASDGRQRALARLDAAQALFGYTLSAGDYQGPRIETGQLRVSVGTDVSYKSAFTVRVTPHL